MNGGQSKPIVSEADYVCQMGAVLNITCDAIKDTYKPYKTVNQEIPTQVQEGYLIEPNTHRIWLTVPEKPREIPDDRLRYYEKSL